MTYYEAWVTLEKDENTKEDPESCNWSTHELDIQLAGYGTDLNKAMEIYNKYLDMGML